MGIVCPTHIPGWHAAKAAERRGDAPQRQMVVHDRTRLTDKVAKQWRKKLRQSFLRHYF